MQQKGKYANTLNSKIIKRFMDEKEWEAFGDEYNAHKLRSYKQWQPSNDDLDLFNKGRFTVDDWEKHWNTSKNTAILKLGKIVLYKELKKQEKTK